MGYLNVHTDSPGWYALGEGYTRPLIIADDQELIYENVGDAYSQPDDFLAFVEGEMNVSSTYNVRVSSPDFS